MNKSLIILSATLLCVFSCKKETEYDKLSTSEPVINGVESTQKAEDNNPKEIEKINADGIAVVSDKDSTQNVSTAFAVTEQGNYKYKYRLKKGETYTLNTTSVNTITQSQGGQSVSEKTTTKNNVSFTVLDAANGNYNMSAVFSDSKSTINSNGQNFTINPKAAKPENPMLMASWIAQKAKLGKTITFLMNNEGIISEVKGYEPILATLKSEINKVVSGEEATQFYQMMAQQISPDAFKTMFEQGVIKFPSKGVKLGEKWSKDSGIQGAKTHFTLKKIENGKATISILAQAPPQTETKTEGGITGTLKATMKQTGTITIDTKTGWVSKANLNDSNTETRTFKKGAESQTMKITSKTNTTIN